MAKATFERFECLHVSEGLSIVIIGVGTVFTVLLVLTVGVDLMSRLVKGRALRRTASSANRRDDSQRRRSVDRDRQGET